MELTAMREEFRVNVLERVLVYYSLGTLLEKKRKKTVKNDRTQFRKFYQSKISGTLYILYIYIYLPVTICSTSNVILSLENMY